ncbi:MAG TPA: COX15/CtaA family protein [Bacteroidia bacterium]|nr:COX15/CtaA family protein [Bacteroidia bacterium]
MNYNKPIYYWLLTGCTLIFVMVIIGGITRLTGSGLSIVRWDIVTGTLPPLNENDWNKSFELYKQTPQFQKINFDFSLDDFKNIFWWEYIHRLIGRIIGIVFIVPFFYFLSKGELKRKLIVKLIIIFLLGGAQGALGWYMVKSGLAYNPHVSHLRLAAHLLTAFLAFGYTFKTTLEIRTENLSVKKKIISYRFVLLSRTLFVLAVIQIVYGAFVAGLKAGLVYNTFPTMEGQWIPDGLFFTTPWWSDITDNTTTVQFIHRLLAYLVATGIIILLFMSRKQENALLKKSSHYLVAIVTLQLLLGISTLLTHVNIYLAVLHQAGAFFLFAAFIYHLHCLKMISDTEKIIST